MKMELDLINIRTFGIKGSRIHVHAPHQYEVNGDKWRIYYYPESTPFPCNIAYADSMEEAYTKALQLAEITRKSDLEYKNNHLGVLY